jgi:hypothetical protein
VQDQSRLAAVADRLDVGAEVLEPRGDDRVGRDGGAGDRDVPAGGDGLLADPDTEVLVEVVEVGEELREPGVAVALRRGLDPVEHLLRDALGVVVAGGEEGFERGEERELRDPLVAVPRDVAGELAGAHREPDEDDVAQVERLQQGVQVGGEGVVVVAGADLRRPAEPAPVVGDDAVAGGEQRGRLALPAVAVQRVPVDEDDRLTCALVLVVELDRGAVLGPDGDVSHDSLSMSSAC